MMTPLPRHDANASGQQPSAGDVRDDRPDGAARYPWRERSLETGLGYGRSSGYGTRLHFEDGHVDPIFRSHW